jgi:hypothetical protein
MASECIGDFAMSAQWWAFVLACAFVALLCAVFAIGGILSRRRRTEGLRAMAAREAETEPASQRTADLHVRPLSDADAEHVRWASALSRELPPVADTRIRSVPTATVSDFDRHWAAVSAILNRPDAITLAFDTLERGWQKKVDKIFANLPEWARVEIA